MFAEILKVIRLLGLRRAARLKRRHEQGLTYVRGYTATCCWWALLTSGFLDALQQAGRLEAPRFAAHQRWNPAVLEAILTYLDGIGLLRREGAWVALTPAGRVLLAEPRGLLELAWAYEPPLANLDALLRGDKQYGRDLQRRITYVGLGSGRLCEQLPYRVMRRMVLAQECKVVLDLGCGDLAFLAGLCRADPTIRCHGLDQSAEMVEFDRRQLQQHDFGGRLSVQQGDMFACPELPVGVSSVDCITACDTFHEYLPDAAKIAGLMRGLKERFPSAVFVIGEFCRQDPAWLRRRRTASLEHHLWHELSGQQIGAARQWRDIFRQAALHLVAEDVYDLIGHGYFTLR